MPFHYVALSPSTTLVGTVIILGKPTTSLLSLHQSERQKPSHQEKIQIYKQNKIGLQCSRTFWIFL